MKVVIDTSSLLSLVRYYLPFDKNSVLFNFIKNKIERNEIIIIDKVHEECEYTSKGLVLKNLPYLEDKAFVKSAKHPYKTDSLIVPSTPNFFHKLEYEFVNAASKKRLSQVEFENQKDQFLEGADMKQIILCLNLIKTYKDSRVILVTEETEGGNDNKLFKKIPTICRDLGIEAMSLPDLLKQYEGIDVEFK